MARFLIACEYSGTERTTPRWHYCKGSARAAISAFRQRAAMDDLLRMDGELYDVPNRPALSEEERARVEDIRQEIEESISNFARVGSTAFLLSLIDKLTEAG